VTTDDLDRQINALTEIVGALATTVSQLNARVDRLTRANRPRGQGDKETDQNRGRSTFRAPGDPPEPPGADHPGTDHAPEDCGGPDARATTGGTTAAGSSGNKLTSHGFGRSR
jgi:hypothetical protein